MSDSSTRQMIDLYMEDAEPPMYLSSFFKSPPKNFHNSELVEHDIIRNTENIAIPVADLAAGGRMNEASKHTNKSYKPPIFKEELSLSAHDLLKRDPGNNPFEQVDYQVAATERVFAASRKLEWKIRRSMEVMAAQTFANGAISLVDESGNAIYELDYVPKATHHITTGTTWAADGVTGDPVTDLDNLGHVIRVNGKRSVTKLIFGRIAMQRYQVSAKVRALLDNRKIELGQLKPPTSMEKDGGAQFMGYTFLGQYPAEMWMYDGFYLDPQTAAVTPYVADQHILMIGERGRYDLTFGGIPRFASPEGRAMSFLPRLSSAALGLDMRPYAWVTRDGLGLTVQIVSRPLTIPTSIDCIGRLDVVI